MLWYIYINFEPKNRVGALAPPAPLWLLEYIKRDTHTRKRDTLQRGKGHTSSGNLFYIFEIRILTIKITITTPHNILHYIKFTITQMPIVKNVFLDMMPSFA